MRKSIFSILFVLLLNAVGVTPVCIPKKQQDSPQTEVVPKSLSGPESLRWAYVLNLQPNEKTCELCKTVVKIPSSTTSALYPLIVSYSITNTLLQQDLQQGILEGFYLQLQEHGIDYESHENKTSFSPKYPFFRYTYNDCCGGVLRLETVVTTPLTPEEIERTIPGVEHIDTLPVVPWGTEPDSAREFMDFGFLPRSNPTVTLI